MLFKWKWQYATTMPGRNVFTIHARDEYGNRRPGLLPTHYLFYARITRMLPSKVTTNCFVFMWANCIHDSSVQQHEGWWKRDLGYPCTKDTLMCLCVCVLLSIHIHICVCVCVCTIHVYITDIYMYIYIAHTHTHTHAHIYIQTGSTTLTCRSSTMRQCSSKRMRRSATTLLGHISRGPRASASHRPPTNRTRARDNIRTASCRGHRLVCHDARRGGRRRGRGGVE